MAKRPTKAVKLLTCRYCSKAGITGPENQFKSKAALRAHERAKHSKRGRPKGGQPKYPALPKSEVIVQEPINFCCYCGKQLPNATILNPVLKR